MKQISIVLLIAALLPLMVSCDEFSIKKIKSTQLNEMRTIIKERISQQHEVVEYSDTETYNTSKTELEVSYRLALNKPIPTSNERQSQALKMSFDFQTAMTPWSPTTTIWGVMKLKKNNGKWACVQNSLMEPDNWRWQTLEPFENAPPW